MSLVITGTNLTFILFFLIALNGFFCFKKIPILAVPIAGISVIFIIGFNIDYNGLSIILSLLLVVCIIANLVFNGYDITKK